jgi:hypothetical protein
LRSHPQLLRLSFVNFLDYLAHAGRPSPYSTMMYRYGFATSARWSHHPGVRGRSGAR